MRGVCVSECVCMRRKGLRTVNASVRVCVHECTGVYVCEYVGVDVVYMGVCVCMWVYVGVCGCMWVRI